MKLDKPFKTYDEQIAHLQKTYGLIISNKHYAQRALETHSYYDLINGYKECFINPSTNKYRDGITMEYLVAFHRLNRLIQNILSDGSFTVENRFKSILAYYVSQNIGERMADYLDPNRLGFTQTKDQKELLNATLDNMRTVAHPQGNHKIALPTRHYVKNHNHVPAWILLRNVSFSNTTTYYRFLPPNVKDLIADDMLNNSQLAVEKKKDALIPMLHMVRKFRNVVTHNLKFITHTEDYLENMRKYQNKRFMQNLFPRSLITNKEVLGRRKLNDAYAYILCLLMLLGKNESAYILAMNLCITIGSWGDELPFINFSDYARVSNLPNNLSDRLEHFQSNLLQKLD